MSGDGFGMPGDIGATIAAALYWREPLWLLLSLLPALLALQQGLRRRAEWAKIGDRELLPWLQTAPPQQRHCRWPRTLLLLSWIAFCVALAGPRTPLIVAAELRATAPQVVLVVDRSASMRALDGRVHGARSNRLADSENLIKGWINEDTEWGLVMFAGHAHSMFPVTHDSRYARSQLRRIDQRPLPTMGNRLGAALNAAISAFPEETGSAARHVILLSDGDIDSANRIDAESVADNWASLTAAKLHIIGIGGDQPLPIPDPRDGWLRVNDEPVLSRRDAQWLRSLAKRAAGDYRSAEDAVSLDKVLGQARPRIPATNHDQVIWREWFHLPLALALITLLAGLFERNRTAGSGKGASAPGLIGVSVLGLISVTLLTSATLHSPAARADPSAHQSITGQTDSAGNELTGGLDEALAALTRGEFASARQRLKDLDGYSARFAEGIACYRLKDPGCAAQAWSAAVLQADDDGERVRAIFNLANLHFHNGQFQQAEVLFEDAGRHWPPGIEIPGLSRAALDTNLAFASELARAVEASRADQRKSAQRAAFRSRAGAAPIDGDGDGTLDAGLAENKAARDRQLAQLTQLAHFARIAEMAGLDRNALHLGDSQSARDKPHPAYQFVQSGQPAGGQAEPENAIWKRLLELESGLPAAVHEARRIHGQRPW